MFLSSIFHLVKKSIVKRGKKLWILITKTVYFITVCKPWIRLLRIESITQVWFSGCVCRQILALIWQLGCFCHWAYFRTKQGTIIGIVLDLKNVRCSFSVMPNPLALIPWRIAKIDLGKCLNTYCCAIALRAHADQLQNINKLPNPVQGCQIIFSQLKALHSLHPLDFSKRKR